MSLAELDVPADTDTGYSFVDDGWPTLLVVEHRPLEPAEVSVMFEEVERYLNRGDRMEIIVESLHGGAQDPATRRFRTEWPRNHRALLATNCRAMAAVTDINPLIRFAASTVMSVMGGSPMPFRLFSDRASAVAWLAGLRT